MAYATKEKLVEALVDRFGAGNVDISDIALPDPNGANLPGCTTHRIKYLDESSDSGQMLAATAIRKADGTWLMVNDIAERNNKTNQLLRWIEHNSRPWQAVTEIRNNFDRNSARIETITNGLIERHLVAKVGNAYTAIKIGDGPFD